ncbi:hypothetical protein RvY_06855 [Ramazzottius varieornatus]|uniref:Ion transport domain-containing protein n=1 Tax=Ramazzottius varieornatus TaxID=947166 RepID=A0A1D1V3C7_RAMVA|nr:hypothetical protein RvY_06855 [Ramazzottius varieornatus]
MDKSYYSDAFLVFDYLGDTINLIDVVVSLLIGYLGEELVVVHEPRLLANHWFDTGGKLDLLSVVPTDLAYIWTGMEHPFPAVRFNRLLKYPKLASFLKKTEGHVPNPQHMRLFALMMKFILLIHLNACLYYFLSEQTGLNTDGWVYPGEAAWRKVDNRNDTLFQKFTWSFYWSFHTLTMIGITKQPETEWQFLLLTADFVLGVMLFSQVLANTMHTVLQSSHETRKFRKKIDAVVAYMDMRNVN